MNIFIDLDSFKVFQIDQALSREKAIQFSFWNQPQKSCELSA